MPHGPCTGCVLVVEDDGDTREALREYLARLGCTVLVAADGLDALRVLRERVTVCPCFLLTDLNMPNLDGAELARCVRASPRDAAMPVVTMSAERDRERPPQADAHLTKPFDLAELRCTTSRLCPGGPATALDSQLGAAEPKPASASLAWRR